MKISEGTEFKIDLKTIVSIIIITASFVGMYFTLQDDISDAKALPEAVIDRIIDKVIFFLTYYKILGLIY